MYSPPVAMAPARYGARSIDTSAAEGPTRGISAQSEVAMTTPANSSATTSSAPPPDGARKRHR